MTYLSAIYHQPEHTPSLLDLHLVPLNFLTLPALYISVESLVEFGEGNVALLAAEGMDIGVEIGVKLPSAGYI